MTDSFNLEPPSGLLEKVLKRVHREERILVFKKTILFSGTLIISLIALIPSLNMLIADFNSTGFLTFSSLMFSDFTIVMAHWQSFTMVLLETLPALSLALFLAVVLTFLQSINSLTKNIKNIKTIRHLAVN